jgi:hypothetical protein
MQRRAASLLASGDDAFATRRLLTSTFTGFGSGLFLFIAGYIGGILVEDYVFAHFGLSFGEGTFAMYTLFPTLPGILLAFVGSLSGTTLVFRKLLPKNNTDNP